MTYPKLPALVAMPAGPVTVLVKPITLKGEEGAVGWWDADSRTVTISPTLERRLQWATLYHELTHAMLSDSGLDYLIDDKMQEALCEANATARMRERFG